MKKEQKLQVLEHFSQELPECGRNVLALQNMKHMAEDMLEGELEAVVIHKGEQLLWDIEQILDRYQRA